MSLSTNIYPTIVDQVKFTWKSPTASIFGAKETTGDASAGTHQHLYFLYTQPPTSRLWFVIEEFKVWSNDQADDVVVHCYDAHWRIWQASDGSGALGGDNVYLDHVKTVDNGSSVFVYPSDLKLEHYPYYLGECNLGQATPWLAITWKTNTDAKLYRSTIRANIYDHDPVRK